MRKYRNGIFYISVTGGFSLLMYIIILFGRKLESGRKIVIPNSVKGQWMEFKDSLVANLENPLAILLAQIVTIIVVARLFGWIFKKIGQPAVIGEIIAGIVLGPSLIGLYFPEFSSALFPSSSLQNLKLLSQIGLILFMFVVGMELDLKVLKSKAHEALIVSHASIIIPFALGMALAYFIYLAYAPSGVPFSSFALFMGIAMSITAFPVLARIVQDRGINRTTLGAVVITCAAVDDISAWCILAALIAIVKAGSFVSSLYTILLAVAYVFMMIKVVKPFFKRIGDLHTSRENLSKPIVAIFFITLLLSSFATESIGIHALFGAFMAGVIMPENLKFRNIFIEKVEDVALVLFLPIFFVFTGLRTEIGLINDPLMWKITGYIILVAVAGKFVGSALAAKFVGQDWKDSLTIGALMNTRGLMELVVLNIGYDLGVLSPEIFAMMVIMALVTTFMTGPALDLINWFYKSKSEGTAGSVREAVVFKILFSFGKPESGKSLLRLANSLTKKMSDTTELTALHLYPTNKINKYNIEEYEKDSFAPVIRESEKLTRKIIQIYKASNDFETEIAEIGNAGKFELLLIGYGQSIFEGSMLGKVLGFIAKTVNLDNIYNRVSGRQNDFHSSPFDDRIKTILSKSRIPVGIFIDRKLTKMERVFIPLIDNNDSYIFDYAQMIIQNNDSHVVIFYGSDLIENNITIKDKIGTLDQNIMDKITFQNHEHFENSFPQYQDIMIISLESWKFLVDSNSLWLNNIPSTLIISDKPKKLASKRNI